MPAARHSPSRVRQKPSVSFKLMNPGPATWPSTSGDAGSRTRSGLGDIARLPARGLASTMAALVATIAVGRVARRSAVTRGGIERTGQLAGPAWP